MDIAGIVESYVKGCAIQSKVKLQLVQYWEAIKEGWKLSGNQEGLILMKDSAKLVFVSRS